MRRRVPGLGALVGRVFAALKATNIDVYPA
jgi:hypothetical protein